MRALRRILAFAAAFAAVFVLVVLVNQTAQLADLADRFHPAAGDFVFWGLVFTYLLCLLVPIWTFLRLPRTLVPPAEDSGPEFERHLAKVASRLRRNPRVSATALGTREEIEAAIAALDGEVERVVRAAGSRVFLATAVSQNGALDALLVLGLDTKLVWDVAHLYSQRPTLRDMAWLYLNVLTTAVVAGEIDDAELTAQIQPVLSSVLGSAAGSVPGLRTASSVFTSSVLSGSANAFLTLRVGIIAQSYCRALVRPAKSSLRRTAIARAAGMLGAIAVEGARKVSTALVKASGRTVGGAVASVGRRVRRAGGSVVERFSPTRDGEAQD